ncbi:mRNA export factor GLE1-like [Humulus lupulus]|uniref:mRNA export factor GLE1-like n=1 Tax=Humulus lupulus TaxID=3486 RepID=UPI002B40C6DE|nr:mRNA export factor GLE1-like [Humulus lupulus]
MEAQRREAKEAAEREANEASSQATVQKEALGLQTKAKTKESEFEKPINSASAGDITKAAEAALKLERERIKKLEDLDEGNKALGLNVNKEVSTGVKKLLRESSGQYSDFSILSSLNSQVNHVTYCLFSRIYVFIYIYNILGENL